MTSKHDSDKIEHILKRSKEQIEQDPNDALRLAIEAIGQAQEKDRKADVARGYYYAGSAHLQLGNTVDSVFMLKRGLAIAEEEDCQPEQVQLLHSLGKYYELLNDLENALDFNQRALELANQMNDAQAIARSKDSMCRIFSNLDNHEKALQLAKEVNEYWKQTENYELLSRSYNNLGIIYSRNGQIEKSIESYRTSLDIARKYHFKVGEAYILNNLASLLMQTDQNEKALEYLHESLRLKEEIGAHQKPINTMLNISKACVNLEQMDKALEYLEKCQKHFDLDQSDNATLKLLKMRTHYYERLAEIARKNKDYEASMKAYDQAIRSYKDYNRGIVNQYTDSTSKRMAELEARYEVMKREQEAKFHQEQNIELSRKNEEIQAQQRKLEEALKQLSNREEQLTRANASKDRFFSIIAHDLKTPLSSVVNGIELLKLRSVHSNDPQIEKVIKIIDRSAGNLAALLQNLLDWARTQRGEIKYRPGSIDLKELIRKITELYFHAAESKKIRLEVVHMTENKAFADPDMIYAILRNLVSNALKFSHSHSTVRIKVEENGVNLHIAVIDHGIGMPKPLKDKLFCIDCAHSRKGTDKETGTGLGLILSKELALVNKGDLTVDSEEGSGSTFTLQIPMMSSDRNID